MTKLNENEHALTTPELIGTDQEKVDGIRFWADIIGMIRGINTAFISYENKKSVIAAFKKELELIEIEIDNISGRVTQAADAVIPSVDQAPKDEPAELNVVDLTKNNEVSNSTAPTVPAKKAPTFESLDKLRRVAGSGIWDKNYVGKAKK